jgi:hypothetical protein
MYSVTAIYGEGVTLCNCAEGSGGGDCVYSFIIPRISPCCTEACTADRRQADRGSVPCRNMATRLREAVLTARLGNISLEGSSHTVPSTEECSFPFLVAGEHCAVLQTRFGLLMFGEPPPDSARPLDTILSQRSILTRSLVLL